MSLSPTEHHAEQSPDSLLVEVHLNPLPSNCSEVSARTEAHQRGRLRSAADPGGAAGEARRDGGPGLCRAGVPKRALQGVRAAAALLAARAAHSAPCLGIKMQPPPLLGSPEALVLIFIDFQNYIVRQNAISESFNCGKAFTGSQPR